MPKTADTRKSFDEWLEKLDEVNDISRSTLNRIKYLESEISNLKRATDKLQTKQNARITSKIPTGPSPPASPKTSSVSATASAIVEKILKRPEADERTRQTTFVVDKQINTDIDLLMMNKILKHWNDGPTSEPGRSSSFQKGSPQQKHNIHQTQEQSTNIVVENSRRAKRRLTTTINRSIEIQTEVFQAEKGVSTDPEMEKPVIESAFRRKNNDIEISNIEDVPILDLPNIETPTPNPYQQQSTSTPMPVPSSSSRRSSRIANPIIEIYSDSDETSFDDFEKNIYNQISKRALIKNQMSNKRPEGEKEQKIYDQKDLDALRVKTSSTQTMAPEMKHQQQSYSRQSRATTPETAPSEDDSESPFQSAGFHEPPTPEIPVQPPPPISTVPATPIPATPTPILKRNLQSSSTILIERVGNNRKEQSEIVLKTNVDNDGVVHRTTEVKNRKFKPKSSASNKATLIANKGQQSQKTASNYHYKDRYLRKVNSDMNVCHSKNYIQRPVSAFDISGEVLDDAYSKRKQSNDLGNILGGEKAFSTIDIPSKSPVISEGYHSEYLDSHPRVDTPTNKGRYIVEPPMAYAALQELETNLDDDVYDDQNDRSEHYEDENKRWRHSSPNHNQWEEISKSQVLNTMTNEALNRYGDVQLGKSSLMTFTNEMVIDTVGKETNITTKSRTIRKYAPFNDSADSGYHPNSRSKSTFDLSDRYQRDPGTYSKASLDRQDSQSHYDLYNQQIQPYRDNEQQFNSHFKAHEQVRFSVHFLCSLLILLSSQNSMIPTDEQPIACNFSLVYNCGNNVVIR